MFYSTLLLAATTLLGAASAQNYSTSSITIDPNTIPIENRTTWCNYERGNCPLVCGGRGNLQTNDCDPNTLIWKCDCVSNTPNISDYTNMIPSLECQQWVIGCVAAAGNDLNALTDCRSVSCGSKDPGSVDQQGSSNGGSQSSSAAASSSAPSSTGGSSGGASKTSSGASAATSTDSAAVLGVARNYGTGILAAGGLALFGLAL